MEAMILPGRSRMAETLMRVRFWNGNSRKKSEIVNSTLMIAGILFVTMCFGLNGKTMSFTAKVSAESSRRCRMNKSVGADVPNGIPQSWHLYELFLLYISLRSTKCYSSCSTF